MRGTCDIAGQVTDDDLVGIKPGTPNDFGPHGWYCDSFMTVIHSFRHPLKANTPYHRSPFMAARLVIPEGERGTVQTDLGNAAEYPRMPEGTILYTRETAAGYDVQAERCRGPRWDSRPKRGSRCSWPSCSPTRTRGAG